MDEKTNGEPIRIGILGAARIAPAAVVRAARDVRNASAYGVAARVPAHAGAFQIKHGLTKAYPSYEALLGAEEVDAVYVPLPNGLHCEWTIRALEAGKHVLCEKPFAANTAEAEQMAEASLRTDRHLMEAFHYRYHPLIDRAREIVESGELGSIRSIETSVCFPLPAFRNIRYDFELGGGATMDAGCYAIHLMRVLAGAEPLVSSAQATLFGPEIDRAMKATLQFPDGSIGKLRCSLFSARLLSVWATVRGDRGELHLLNPILPHLYHRLTVRTGNQKRSERIYGESTYTLQLRAFVDLIENDVAVATGPADAIANMRVIDAIYDQAGLPRRGARPVANN